MRISNNYNKPTFEGIKLQNLTEILLNRPLTFDVSIRSHSDSELGGAVIDLLNMKTTIDSDKIKIAQNKNFLAVVAEDIKQKYPKIKDSFEEALSQVKKPDKLKMDEKLNLLKSMKDALPEYLDGTGEMDIKLEEKTIKKIQNDFFNNPREIKEIKAYECNIKPKHLLKILTGKDFLVIQETDKIAPLKIIAQLMEIKTYKLSTLNKELISLILKDFAEAIRNQYPKIAEAANKIDKTKHILIENQMKLLDEFKQEIPLKDDGYVEIRLPIEVVKGIKAKYSL